MTEAIAHILAIYPYSIFYKGGNFTQFLTPDNNIVELMFDYVAKKWMLYKEVGKSIEPSIKIILTF